MHNATAAGGEPASIDLAAGVRQDASGLLGTTVILSDLVCHLSPSNHCFDAGMVNVRDVDQADPFLNK